MELRSRLQNEQQQMADAVKSLQLKLNEEKGNYYFCLKAPFYFVPFRFTLDAVVKSVFSSFLTEIWQMFVTLGICSYQIYG